MLVFFFCNAAPLRYFSQCSKVSLDLIFKYIFVVCLARVSLFVFIEFTTPSHEHNAMWGTNNIIIHNLKFKWNIKLSCIRNLKSQVEGETTAILGCCCAPQLDERVGKHCRDFRNEMNTKNSSKSKKMSDCHIHLIPHGMMMLCSETFTSDISFTLRKASSILSMLLMNFFAAHKSRESRFLWLSVPTHSQRLNISFSMRQSHDELFKFTSSSLFSFFNDYLLKHKSWQ